jgi:hypothetical protein
MAGHAHLHVLLVFMCRTILELVLIVHSGSTRIGVLLPQ